MKKVRVIGLVSAGIVMAGTLAACSAGTKEDVTKESTTVAEVTSDTGSSTIESSETATSQSNTSAAGKYEGDYYKMVADEKPAEDEAGFSLVLNEDGTGTHNRNGMDYEVTWESDGTNLTMTEKFMGVEQVYKGTITDTGLDLFFGDPDNQFSFEYVYKRV